MSKKDVSHMRQQFANAVASPNTQEFENIMKAYGTEVVGLVGAQVSSILTASHIARFPTLLACLLTITQRCP
jgi:hypothetical protein